jgi:hypothetical protein
MCEWSSSHFVKTSHRKYVTMTFEKSPKHMIRREKINNWRHKTWKLHTITKTKATKDGLSTTNQTTECVKLWLRIITTQINSKLHDTKCETMLSNNHHNTWTNERENKQLVTQDFQTAHNHEDQSNKRRTEHDKSNYWMCETVTSSNHNANQLKITRQEMRDNDFRTITTTHEQMREKLKQLVTQDFQTAHNHEDQSNKRRTEHDKSNYWMCETVTSSNHNANQLKITRQEMRDNDFRTFTRTHDKKRDEMNN